MKNIIQFISIYDSTFACFISDEGCGGTKLYTWPIFISLVHSYEHTYVDLLISCFARVLIMLSYTICIVAQRAVYERTYKPHYMGAILPRTHCTSSLKKRNTKIQFTIYSTINVFYCSGFSYGYRNQLHSSSALINFSSLIIVLH